MRVWKEGSTRRLLVGDLSAPLIVKHKASEDVKVAVKEDLIDCQLSDCKVDDIDIKTLFLGSLMCKVSACFTSLCSF